MKKYTSFKEQKGARYIQNVCFGIIIFSCFLFNKPCLRLLLICFARKIKGLYQSSFRNEIDFTNIMNVSPHILAKNQNFRKLRHSFVDGRAMITTTLISSYHWKTLVPFCLPNSWKRTFKTNSELLLNQTKKQFMPSKTTVNWLFNCLCYLVTYEFHSESKLCSLPEYQGLNSKQVPYLKFKSPAERLSVSLETNWLWVQIPMLAI